MEITMVSARNPIWKGVPIPSITNEKWSIVCTRSFALAHYSRTLTRITYSNCLGPVSEHSIGHYTDSSEWDAFESYWP